MSSEPNQTPPDADSEIAQLRQQVLDGWESEADFFDERWGDQGDEFHHGVFAPAAERLLGLESGARLIEYVIDDCFGSGEPHGLTIHRYLSRYATHGVTNTAQKQPQVYFHRPMSELLGDAFASGLVLDGMEELPAPEQPMAEAKLIWNMLPEIPMAVALRFRRV